MAYQPKSIRPCKICGEDLNHWGPDRKGVCPDCSRALKDTAVPCAGRCKNVFPLKNMEIVSMFFEPGVKGGKKYNVYYCQQCLLAARSRARSVSEKQQEVLSRTKGRQTRDAAKRKRGGKKE